jgi:hypothetical protein
MKNLNFVFKNTTLDESAQSQIDTKKNEKEKYNENRKRGNVNKMRDISKSILKTVEYYNGVEKNTIDKETIDTFKQIINKERIDNNFYNKIAKNAKNAKDNILSKKLENTVKYFKNGFNNVVITDDVLTVFNNSLKIDTLEQTELDCINKMYKDGLNVHKQKIIQLNTKITQNILTNNIDELRKNNEELLKTIDLFISPDFSLDISLGYITANFIKYFEYLLENNEIVRKYNGIYFHPMYIHIYFDILRYMCDSLVGSPDPDDTGSKRLKLIKEKKSIRISIVKENLFEPITNDYKGVLSCNNDVVKKNIILIRTMRILASNDNYEDFMEDLNLLKTEGVEFLEDQLKGVDLKINELEKNEGKKTDIEEQLSIRKKLQIKIKSTSEYNFDMIFAKEISTYFSSAILEKCGYKIRADNFDRARGKNRLLKNGGDKIYRIFYAIPKSCITII